MQCFPQGIINLLTKHCIIMKTETNHEKQKAEILANLVFNLLPRCQQKEMQLAEKNHLLHSEFKCLHFFDSDKKLNNSSIAEKMNMSPSRSTRIVDGLVTKDFLIREEDPEDRRNVVVSLSKKGKLLTHKLDKEYINLHSEILKDMDSSQRMRLISAVENLNSAIEVWLQKPRISFLDKRKSADKDK